jgi:hypothetical protein
MHCSCQHYCWRATYLLTFHVLYYQIFRFGPAGSAFTSDQLMDAVEVVVPYYI